MLLLSQLRGKWPHSSWFRPSQSEGWARAQQRNLIHGSARFSPRLRACVSFLSRPDVSPANGVAEADAMPLTQPRVVGCNLNPDPSRRVYGPIRRSAIVTGIPCMNDGRARPYPAMINVRLVCILLPHTGVATKSTAIRPRSGSSLTSRLLRISQTLRFVIPHGRRRRPVSLGPIFGGLATRTLGLAADPRELLLRNRVFR